MGTDVIKVYARLKPENDRDRVTNYRIHRRPKDHTEEDFLVLHAPIKLDEYIDHRPESWNFSFHRIIDEEANQCDVFEDIGRPVIESVLDGYNGTVFAYGQTGSGKTYSITGEGTTSDSQGIIPRTLRYLFNVIRMHPESVYSVDVAYLEIYNEYGYDLLDRRQVYQQQQAMRLEDLPHVIIQEDEKGRLHLKNLTFHNVKSEDQAMELFLLGDSRRITADTPMNPQSSRSHCILTIVVSIKQLGASRYKKAKMHLVDLAGSERVYKCAISGTILNEAKHINLSLHYLEQVIVCLGQESTGHIPYRNCLLTAILRDSLGGNCVTRMLATLSVSSINLEETISTCRFAQRVALVRNDAKLIMEHDLDSENTLLKLENEKLRKQVEDLTMQNENLKNMIPLKESREDSVKKLEYYKNLVEQRDKEISVLISLLKKAKVKKDQVKLNGERKKKSPGTDKIPMDSKNDLEMKKEDSNNELNVHLNNELDRSLDIQNLENDETNKTLKANPIKIGTLKLKEKSVTQDLENNEINKILKANPINTETLKLKGKPVTKNIDHTLENDKILSLELNANETVKNQFPDIIMNGALITKPIVGSNQSEKEDLKTSVESSKNDYDFDKDLPLTGDPEIDEEIVAFYKAKRTGGVY